MKGKKKKDILDRWSRSYSLKCKLIINTLTMKRQNNMTIGSTYLKKTYFKKDGSY